MASVIESFTEAIDRYKTRFLLFHRLALPDYILIPEQGRKEEREQTHKERRLGRYR